MAQRLTPHGLEVGLFINEPKNEQPAKPVEIKQQEPAQEVNQKQKTAKK